jgi:hypothetical protein
MGTFAGRVSRVSCAWVVIRAPTSHRSTRRNHKVRYQQQYHYKDTEDQQYYQKNLVAFPGVRRLFVGSSHFERKNLVNNTGGAIKT